MKKIMKLFLALFMIISIAGCQNKKDDVFNIICPTGAPSLSLVSIYQDVKDAGGTVDFVEGSDQLVAELSKKEHSYNIIVAPISLGAKLISAKQSDYKLAGVLTWGNLYLVGSDENVLKEEGEIALFGEGAVPQMIYNTVGVDTTLTPQYYAGAPIVQQQLLSGKVKAAMLAEPLATATIAKAKQNGLDLKIIGDLQKMYGESGYPQAAIFVEEGLHCDELFEKLNTFTENGYETLHEDVEAIGVDTLGLPGIEIVAKTVERQNLHFKTIADCKDNVTEFLSHYNIELADDAIYQ